MIAETRDLPEDQIYSKERQTDRRDQEGTGGRTRCQVFAVYTQKHDVTARLERILSERGYPHGCSAGQLDTSKREAWYARQIKDGVQVVICHPKLVETGLDLAGLSHHPLLRVRIFAAHLAAGQPPVVADRPETAGAGEVSLLRRHHAESCLRLMGKKLLVALTMEGKFAGEGLQSIDEDDDMLSAMARELVEKNGIGETADSVWRALTTIIRNYSRPVLIARILPHSSKRRALCWILRLLRESC